MGHLDQLKIGSKVRTSPSGRKTGGGSYSRGALYRILANRIYIGEIFHKGNSYPGQHEAIIEVALWQAVQAKLAENTHARRLEPTPMRPASCEDWFLTRMATALRHLTLLKPANDTAIMCPRG